MKRTGFSIFEGILLTLAGIGVGGLSVLIINTIQTTKIKNSNPIKYNINAVLEPEINTEEKKGN